MEYVTVATALEPYLAAYLKSFAVQTINVGKLPNVVTAYKYEKNNRYVQKLLFMVNSPRPEEPKTEKTILHIIVPSCERFSVKCRHFLSRDSRLEFERFVRNAFWMHLVEYTNDKKNKNRFIRERIEDFMFKHGVTIEMLDNKDAERIYRRTMQEMRKNVTEYVPNQTMLQNDTAPTFDLIYS